MGSSGRRASLSCYFLDAARVDRTPSGTLGAELVGRLRRLLSQVPPP